MTDPTRPRIADLVVEDEDYVDSETCDHLKYPTVKKFDSGRLPVLCGNCAVILWWDR